MRQEEASHYDNGNQQPNYSQNNSSSPNYNTGNSNTGNGGNGGYNNNSNGGNKPTYDKPFTPSFKVGIPTAPYNTVGVIFAGDVELTQQHLQTLVTTLDKLTPYGFTVRYQEGKVPTEVSDCPLAKERYLPFPGFDDVPEGDLIFGSKANKELLPIIHPKGEELSKGQISVNASNVGIMTGSFNNSPLRLLIVVSKDGATHASECGRDTGWVSPTIKMAGKFGIPVININDGIKATQKLDTVLSNF